MTDKLSLEELIVCFRCLSRNLKNIHKRPDFCNQYARKTDVPWAICANSFHQIKSMLQPAPEETTSLFNKKRRRKVLDWAERWKNNLPFKAYQDLLAILKEKE